MENKHPTLTNRVGTTDYYFHCDLPEFRYPKNKFTAENETQAKAKLLEMLDATPTGDWRFRGECSKNRGFRIQTNRGEVTLWHIIRY